MKNINQNIRFSIHTCVLVLLCYAVTPSAMASHIGQSEYNNSEASHFSTTNQGSVPMRQLMLADNSADEEVDMHAKREMMIKDCEDNRGVDCEKKVDTELEAQQLDHNVIIDQDGRLRPAPRPPRPRPRVNQ